MMMSTMTIIGQKLKFNIGWRSKRKLKTDNDIDNKIETEEEDTRREKFTELKKGEEEDFDSQEINDRLDNLQLCDVDRNDCEKRWISKPHCQFFATLITTIMTYAADCKSSWCRLLCHSTNGAGFELERIYHQMIEEMRLKSLDFVVETISTV